MSRANRRQQVMDLEPERDARPRGIVEDFVSKHEGTIQTVMPILGAAGGALAIEVLSQRTTMKKEALAAFGAGLAFVAATNTTGHVRTLALGAAAAGASLAIVETLRAKRPEGIYGPEPRVVEVAPRQAAPGGVSREEFQEALTELARQRDNEVEAIKKESIEAIAQLRQAYEAQIAEMHATIQTLLQQLRDAGAAPAAARNTAPRRPRRETPPIEEVPFEPPAENAEVEPASNEDGGQDAAKIAAVYNLLTDEEAARLHAVMTDLPPSALAIAQDHLLASSPEDAVDYLRETLLARRAA